jgi:hypothetical protein
MFWNWTKCDHLSIGAPINDGFRQRYVAERDRLLLLLLVTEVRQPVASSGS